MLLGSYFSVIFFEVILKRTAKWSKMSLLWCIIEIDLMYEFAMIKSRVLSEKSFLYVRKRLKSVLVVWTFRVTHSIDVRSIM